MIGGPNVGSALQAAAGGFTFSANIANYNAEQGVDQRAATTAAGTTGSSRSDLADKELEQIDKSIAAAELRIAIAEKELENHVLQIENAKAIDAFMRSKYTNEELYQWQIGQISGVYFQSYQLAYDLAKRAERCFRFELGLQDSSYINFGYWDSLKKGLLSGEKLQYDLRRLETAYLEQNRREFELTKHVSLALLDPLALVKLRETGRCFFRLPEEIFDLDYPGPLLPPHQVGEPDAAVRRRARTRRSSCTLRLLKNSIRINTANGDNGYPRNTDDEGLPADDTRFIENNIPVKAIAASSAQNDSGVFELNFRDERYLPFEGAGAISEWSLELFTDLPRTTRIRQPGLRQAAAPVRLQDDHRRHPARQVHGAGRRRPVQERRDQPSARRISKRTTRRRRCACSTCGRSSRRSGTASCTRPIRRTATCSSWRCRATLFRDAGRRTRRIKVNTISLLARCSDAGKLHRRAVAAAAGAAAGGLRHDGPRAVESVRRAALQPEGGRCPRHRAAADGRAAGLAVDDDASGRRRHCSWIPAKNVMEVEDVFLVLGYEWE